MSLGPCSDMDVRTIYFIRHGESTSNAACKLGETKVHSNEKYTDAQLTELGIQQAVEVQRESSYKLQVDVVVCSPLRRAIETAIHVFPGRIIHLEARARELNWSHIECTPKKRASPWDKSSLANTIKLISKRFPRAIINIDEGSILRLDSRQEKYWQPDSEGSMPEKIRLDMSAEAVNSLLPTIFLRKEKVIAVVAHWGVLKHILNVNASNCGFYKARISKINAIDFYVESVERLYTPSVVQCNQSKPVESEFLTRKRVRQSS
jgi:broad specificity phosphatase PhoE